MGDHERELPTIFSEEADEADEWRGRDPAPWERPDDQESHRGAFGDYGGETGGLIERTFRERIVLVGVTLSGDDTEETDASLDEPAACADCGTDPYCRIDTAAGTCTQDPACNRGFCLIDAAWNMPRRVAEVASADDVSKVLAFANDARR